MSLLKRFAAQFRKLLPTPGNVIFTLLIAGSLALASRAGALSPNVPDAPTLSTNTIPYQGRIANAGGTPVTGNVAMTFRLYNIASGGTALWEEAWTVGNQVRVSDGLFNVMLGSLVPIPQSLITGNSNLWLGIKVGSDAEMLPRMQLGSVPFATQALTVPDGSITSVKIADGSVTQAKLSYGLLGTFGGRANSYPYITHLTHFQLNVGSFGYGYPPGDVGDPWGTTNGLNYFTDGTKLYTPSGNGHVHTANNGVSGQPKWGYSFSYFLNNPQAGRTINIPTSTCNDVAIYSTTGSTTPNALGTVSTQLYHRFPGNNNPNVNSGCPCEVKTHSLSIPSGDFRLTFLTRGADCTSYLTVGTRDTNWITDAGLTVDWPNLRKYIGED